MQNKHAKEPASTCPECLGCFMLATCPLAHTSEFYPNCPKDTWDYVMSEPTAGEFIPEADDFEDAGGGEQAD